MSGLLNHQPIDVIGQLLVDLELGSIPGSETSSAWPVLLDVEPDIPDNCITVYSTAGTADGWKQINGDRLDNYGLQIRIRGATKPVAEAKARAIAQALDRQTQLRNVTLDSSVYTVWSVDRTTYPIFLGEADESKRFVFVINALTALELRSS